MHYDTSFDRPTEGMSNKLTYKLPIDLMGPTDRFWRVTWVLGVSRSCFHSRKLEKVDIKIVDIVALESC